MAAVRSHLTTPYHSTTQLQFYLLKAQLQSTQPFWESTTPQSPWLAKQQILMQISQLPIATSQLTVILQLVITLTSAQVIKAMVILPSMGKLMVTAILLWKRVAVTSF